MLNEKSILTNFLTDTPENAIKKSGELLKKGNYISERYIDKMLETYKTNGAYIVIAPGIAMPHARPEDGVIKSGISLITLKSPLNFGNKENDPVKLVIGLATGSNEEHIKILKILSDVFSDENKIEKIINSENKNEIISFFKGVI